MEWTCGPLREDGDLALQNGSVTPNASRGSLVPPPAFPGGEWEQFSWFLRVLYKQGCFCLIFPPLFLLLVIFFLNDHQIPIILCMQHPLNLSNSLRQRKHQVWGHEPTRRTWPSLAGALVFLKQQMRDIEYPSTALFWEIQQLSLGRNKRENAPKPL